MTTRKYPQLAELIEERAPTITTAELAQRRAGATAGNVVRLRPRGVQVAAVVGAAAVVAGLVVTGVQLGGSPVRSQAAPPPRPQHRTQHAVHGVRLTAAMVRHIARASDLALATAGHVFVTYTDVLGKYPDGAGSLDITFSNQNFNSVSRQGSSQPFTERVVGGRIFLFGDPPPGQPLQWYLSTTETSGGQTVPDPRTLLSALRATAGFEDLGQQVVDGVKVEYLRATNVSGLNTQLLSLGLADQPIAQLDIWVDSSGVIRFMDLSSRAAYDRARRRSVAEARASWPGRGVPPRRAGARPARCAGVRRP